MIGDLATFRMWCQKVLPLVYDNSLSYYEVLCKVVDYLNNTIDAVNMLDDAFDENNKEVEEYKAEVDALKDDISKGLIEFLGTIIKCVFFEITDAGYFVAYIPENWEDIIFNTTGLDITVECQPEYGHLVLSY